MEDSDCPQPNESTSSVRLQVGSIFLDKYQILEYLASGANGQVFKTLDLHRKINVALKIIPLSGGEKQIPRFQREAQLASKLRHECIATIFDFGTDQQLTYLAMEFVDGEPIDKFFQKQEKHDLVTFANVFMQTATAISHAHKRGVIHRDLKPGNILVGANSNGTLTAKILDFGLAMQLNEEHLVVDGKLTATGLIVGTPLYMSPEQARALPITPQADIYSIGAVMYQCLTGNAPLVGSTAIETILLISSKEAPSLAESFEEGELPNELVELVDAMLLKEPEERPDLDSEIIPTLETLRIEAAPPSTTSEKTHDATSDTKDGSLRGLVLIVSVLLIIGAISILAVSIVFPKEEEGPATPHVEDKYDREITLDAPLPEYKLKGPIIKAKSFFFDDGIVMNIKEPDNVRVLDADNTKLSSLTNIKRLTNLDELNLKGTDISDDSIQNLVGTKIRDLNVSNTKLTENCLNSMSKMNSLRVLNLSNTKVSPTGEKPLPNLGMLRSITLKDPYYKEAEIERFAQVLAPNCSIVFSEDSVSKDGAKRLQKKFPDLCFNGSKPRLIDKLLALGQDAAKSTNTKKDWLKIKSEYQALLKEASAIYTNSSPRLASYYEGMGSMDVQIPGMEESALKNFQTAFKLAQEGGYIDQEVRIIRPLLISAEKLLDEKSLKATADETLSCAKTLGVSGRDIAENYRWIAQLRAPKHEFAIAEYFYRKAIEAEESQGESPQLAQYYCYLGDSCSEVGKKSEALRVYLKSIEIFEKHPPTDETLRWGYVMAYTHAASLFQDKSDFKSAKTYSDKANQLVHMTGYVPDIRKRTLTVFDRLRIFELMKRPSSEIKALKKEFNALKAQCPRCP